MVKPKQTEIKNNLIKLQEIVDLVQEDWDDLTGNQQLKKLFFLIDALNASELIEALPTEIAGEEEHPHWKLALQARTEIIDICEFAIDHKNYALQYRYSQPMIGITVPGERNTLRASTGIYDKVGKISIYPFNPETGKAYEGRPFPLFLNAPSPYTPLFLSLFLASAYLPRNIESDKKYPGLRKCNGCSRLFIQTTKREKLFHSKECLARFTAKKSREDVKRINELSEKGLSVEEIAKQINLKTTRINDVLNK